MNNPKGRNTTVRECAEPNKKAKVSNEAFAFFLPSTIGSEILCSAIVNGAHAFVIYVSGFVNHVHAIVNAAPLSVIPAHPIVNRTPGFVIRVIAIVNAAQSNVISREDKVNMILII
jgi:hypothetical protein